VQPSVFVLDFILTFFLQAAATRRDLTTPGQPEFFLFRYCHAQRGQGHRGCEWNHLALHAAQTKFHRIRLAARRFLGSVRDFSGCVLGSAMSFPGRACLTNTSRIGGGAALRNPGLDLVEAPAGAAAEFDRFYELAGTPKPPERSSGNLKQFSKLGR